MESWKVIPFAPDYEISDEGNVRRCTPGKRTRVGLPRKQWEVRGYKYVTLHINGRHRGFQVHRVVMETFVEASPLQVNHKNGNRADNRLENLEYVTGKENQAHSRDVLKTMPMGERHHNSKLTKEKVQRIFELREGGLTHKEIGRVVGCSGVNVGYILKGKAWAHFRRPTQSM
jgi:hypothetical protein